MNGDLFIKENVININNFSSFEEAEYILPETNLKIIANLSNGELYLAQSITTSTEIDDKKLLNRLHQILSIKNDLLTPYFGYTEQNPHILISKFFETDHLTCNSTTSSDILEDTNNFLLYHILHQISNTNQKIEWFTSTYKTQIAFCVAKSMTFLHANNIIHENLHPMTIKIVKKSHVPHLFDYGLNEFRGNPINLNKNRYNAPELKKITDYSKETDVFAFGVLLCDLLNAENYKENQNQPPNFERAPKKLKQLIEKCLSKNPKDRPTFSNIYKQFKYRLVLYPETNEEKYQKFIDKIENSQELSNKNRKKSLVSEQKYGKTTLKNDKKVSFLISNKDHKKFKGNSIKSFADSKKDLSIKRKNISEDKTKDSIISKNQSIGKKKFDDIKANKKESEIDSSYKVKERTTLNNNSTTEEKQNNKSNVNQNKQAKKINQNKKSDMKTGYEIDNQTFLKNDSQNRKVIKIKKNEDSKSNKKELEINSNSNAKKELEINSHSNTKKELEINSNSNTKKELDKEISIPKSESKEITNNIDISESEKRKNIQNNKIINIDEYKKLRKLGAGSFSNVYLVKNKATGKIYAAKRLNNKISKKLLNDDNTLHILREIKLMSILNHPSIIDFIGFSNVDFRHSYHPMIFTKYAKNGTLKNILELEEIGLPPKGWDETRKLINIYGIASGMLYLHSNYFIHRDLKPENVLMDEYLFPKISDFGLSKEIESKNKMPPRETRKSPTAECFRQSSVQKHPRGTALYMSPESLDENLYTKSGDVFSFGVLVYEMMDLKNPFSTLTLPQLYIKIFMKGERPNFSKVVSSPMKNLINRCWAQNPTDRPTFEEIVDDLRNNKDYITDLINEEEYYNYIDFIDNCSYSFNFEDQIHFEDLVRKKGKTTMIQKVNIENIEDENNIESTDEEESDNESTDEEESDNESTGEEENDNESTGEEENDNESINKEEMDNESYSEEEIESTNKEKNDNDAEDNSYFYESTNEEENDNDAINKYTNNQEDYVSDLNSLDQYSDYSLDINHRRKSQEKSFFRKQAQKYKQKLISQQKIIQKLKKENEDQSSLIDNLKKQNRNKIPTHKKLNYTLYMENVEEIGYGGISKVSKALIKKNILIKKITLKDIREENISNFVECNEKLIQIKHPNIARIHDVCIDINNPTIYYDYYTTNLQTMIKNKNLSNKEIINCIYQIAEGMNFAHSQKVIHRNLKPTNILIFEEKSGFTVKITDFGIANLMSLEDQSLSCISSQIFMAPELLKEDLNYTEKVDVYSFGVLLYFILSGGELPNINLIEILTGKKAKLPENFNNNAKELIYECWSFNPQNRPNFKDILNWIKLKNYCLVDLSQPEIDQIKKDINEFKITIPLYE